MGGGSHDWLGLAGKVCAVTGAGGGIGRATALGFARAGAKVVLLERNEANARATAEAITAETSTDAVVAVADVADQASVEAAAALALTSVGPCDVLVNTAALLRPGPLDELPLAEWNALLAVNLTGYFLTAQAFGRQMRAKSAGAMVHIASMAAGHAQGYSGAYSVSKAGIVMLSRQIATEWGPHGVRSNVVSPGMVETPMSQSFYDTPGVRERRSAVVPVGRIGQPQDMADAVLFLASPRAGYISGDEIVVDGGFTRMIMNLIPRPGFDKV
jgi:NAD(P)-dependent dehydrogenase (short-subunit alcohol dehydrogenase family)